jgi:glycosyltransferase involved in cell wall biosynthesis
MKVSIITVVYNAINTLGSTINSVLTQQYGDIEYILVDGNSKDGSRELIQSTAEKHSFRWVSEPDKGIYDAMNKGIRMATGDIVGILNADDFYAHEHVISQVVDTFRRTKADGVYGDLAYVDAENVQRVVRYWKSGQYRHGAFRNGWMPPHPTFFVRREMYEKFNTFDLRLKSAADYELMLRFIHKHRISVAYLPNVMVMMRTGGASNANLRNRFRANQEDRLAWKMNGLAPHPLTLLLKPLRKVGQYFLALWQSPASVPSEGYARQ